MKRRHPTLISCAAAGIALLLALPCAQAASAPDRDKSSLQKEQKNLKGQISTVRKDISRKEASLDRAMNDLRQAEKAISDSNRRLKGLGEKRGELEEQLGELRRESREVNMNVKDAEGMVGIISQSQFVNSRRHPWQTVITGGNPNEIARHSAILSYMAREQDKTIDNLENRQKNIAANTAAIDKNRRELARLEVDAAKNRDQLSRDKSLREVAMESLKQELSTARERYEQLVQNDRQLSGLIADLDKRIAENARKQKALEQRRARELAERKKKEAEEAAKPRSSTRTAAAKAKPDVRPVIQAPVIGDFGKLRGRLRMPTKGTIAAKFGQKREGAASSLTWRGLLIRAKMGQEVVATAGGTVVFADWMRGFGNLLIIDHGTNYLSVYANNESLYKETGDTVRAGETIASVGKSGGEDSPGLYFELRYKGKPFDPARWIASR